MGGAALLGTETVVTEQLLLYNKNKILLSLISYPLSSLLFVVLP